MSLLAHHTRLAATGIALAAAVTIAGLSSAAAGATPANPWHRYHQADFKVPAGGGCSFAVRGHVVYDREYVRVLSRFDNGKPRVELFRGPLVIQYTNLSTGTKVIRNQAGVGVEKFTRGGGFVSIKVISGHFGATLPKGSDPSQGIYYAGGQGTALFANGDGTYTLHLGPHGTAQNLCPILGRS